METRELYRLRRLAFKRRCINDAIDKKLAKYSPHPMETRAKKLYRLKVFINAYFSRNKKQSIAEQIRDILRWRLSRATAPKNWRAKGIIAEDGMVYTSQHQFLIPY